MAHASDNGQYHEAAKQLYGRFGQHSVSGFGQHNVLVPDPKPMTNIYAAGYEASQ